MWHSWWKSIQRVFTWWVALASFLIAVIPIPTDWSTSISINLRVFIAVIFFIGLVIWTFYDLSIKLYHKSLEFEEAINKTDVTEFPDGTKVFELNINYHPAFRSLTQATIFLKTEGKKNVDPVYHRLCNGTVIKISENQSIKIVCNMNINFPKRDEIEQELLNTDRKRSDAKLVASPYYEPERMG